MKEEWKPIVGYEGLYEVSNFGRIKTLYNRYKDVIYLKYNTSPNGYYCVNLVKNKISKTIRIHRLVAEHFINNPQNKPMVNHKDGDKKNNFVDNLEWVTASENIKHSFKNGLSNKKGSHHHLSKLDEGDVLVIRILAEATVERKKIAEAFRVSRQCVDSIINGKTWRHI
jgi:predicted RNA binding protein YcfA (HicA-like mRNA interferase family)